MVAEPWLLKMGNQVSSNLKHALYLENSAKSSSGKKQGLLVQEKKQTLGILAFEVANVMSKVVHLHKSLTHAEILKLKKEILNSEGIKALASIDDEHHLLELALIEKLDDLNRVACVVSRLGQKSTIPALQGFKHVYADIVSGAIDIKELSFLVKDMESMVRKMERYASATAALYAEMEVANELESAAKKFRQNQMEETRKAFEQKLLWQKQDVKHLQDISLWNQTYDKSAELLARTVCTIYARICIAFGDEKTSSSQFRGNLHRLTLRKSISAKNGGNKEGFESRSSSFRPKLGSQKDKEGSFSPQDFKFACSNNPARLFAECLTLSSSASKADDEDDHSSYDDQSSQVSGFSTISRSNFIRAITREPKGSSVNSPIFGPKSHLLSYAPPTTLGGSALALHYANIIIVLEKLLSYPHLVGYEARDELYHMLTDSIRETLKRKLKPYAKEVSIYDAHLAHDWREKADRAVEWLGRMAHNTMRWQGERNSLEQSSNSRMALKRTTTNVLLIETLYFADREKTEAVICEVLVGLNYICRYEQQQNALLDCESSFDYEEAISSLRSS